MARGHAIIICEKAEQNSDQSWSLSRVVEGMSVRAQGAALPLFIYSFWTFNADDVGKPLRLALRCWDVGGQKKFDSGEIGADTVGSMSVHVCLQGFVPPPQAGQYLFKMLAKAGDARDWTESDASWLLKITYSTPDSEPSGAS